MINNFINLYLVPEVSYVVYVGSRISFSGFSCVPLRVVVDSSENVIPAAFFPKIPVGDFKEALSLFYNNCLFVI